MISSRVTRRSRSRERCLEPDASYFKKFADLGKFDMRKLGFERGPGDGCENSRVFAGGSCALGVLGPVSAILARPNDRSRKSGTAGKNCGFFSSAPRSLGSDPSQASQCSGASVLVWSHNTKCIRASPLEERKIPFKELDIIENERAGN